MVDILPRQEDIPSTNVQQQPTQQLLPFAAPVSGLLQQHPIYRNNEGIIESLFNKLKTIPGFRDLFSTYFPTTTFAPPFIPQGNLPYLLEEMRRQQQMMAIVPPPNPSTMVPMNYYQQQQHDQQLLLFLMMMQQQQQQQPYLQQMYLQQQQMAQYQLMQQQQQIAAMSIQRNNSTMNYPTINNGCPQSQPYYPQQPPYYPQQPSYSQSYYPQQMLPYEDFSRNYPVDTRYGFYPQINRFGSIKDLRPY